MKTILATEKDLMIENDVHPFDQDLPKTVNFDEQMHPGFADGSKVYWNLGGYSERINYFGGKTSRLRKRFPNQVLHVPRTRKGTLGPR